VSDVQTWSTTAASNNSASPNGFPENMPPSGVNDSAREVMAAVAKYRADTDGVNTSTGSANAYVLAASRTMTAYAQGDRFCFKANFANTGAATLNVDSLGAKDIKRLDGSALVAGDIAADAIVDVVYDGTNFQLLPTLPRSEYLTSVSGTDTITASGAVGAYAAGQRFHFISAGANTGAVTLNINSIGAKAVTKHGTTALLAGDIQSGQVVTVTYDGTRFQVDHIQPASTGAACALLETETASTSATLDFALDLTNYARHVIYIDNLKPVTDGAEFWGRVSSDGVTYATTAYRWGRESLTDAGTSAVGGSTNDAKFQFGTGYGNVDGEQASGTIEITSIGGMGVRIIWRISGENSAGVYYMTHGWGAYVAAVSTYFRLMFSTGNISSGTARMYGFKV